MTANAKRKYYKGMVEFNIDGSINNSYYSRYYLFHGEIVSYNGGTSLVVNRNGTIYDLSNYIFEGVKFHAPNTQKGYNFTTRKHEDIVAEIIGPLKMQNFAFTDHLKYEYRDKNGHYFESLLTKKKHYVTGSDFDMYFVPNMERGEIKGDFTYAKHGSQHWVTLITD